MAGCGKQTNDVERHCPEIARNTAWLAGSRKTRCSSMKTIRHTDTLAYHGGVQVFADRDDAGDHYIDVRTDSHGGIDRYAVVEFSAECLVGVCSGRFRRAARSEITRCTTVTPPSG